MNAKQLKADRTLVVEFESNVQILDADIAENEEAYSRIGMLDRLADAALLALDGNKISEQLVPYLQWAGFDPEMDSVQAVDFQHGTVLPVIARASSDQVWSSDERRELRALLSDLLALHGYVLDNQRELRAAAAGILTFLREEH